MEKRKKKNGTFKWLNKKFARLFWYIRHQWAYKYTARGNLFPSLMSPKSLVKAGLVELAPSTLPNLVQT